MGLIERLDENSDSMVKTSFAIGDFPEKVLAFAEVFPLACDQLEGIDPKPLEDFLEERLHSFWYNNEIIFNWHTRCPTDSN